MLVGLEKRNTDYVFHTEHDWYLHRLSFTWTRRHILLIKAGPLSSHGFYLDWILCRSDHMGKQPHLPTPRGRF